LNATHLNAELDIQPLHLWLLWRKGRPKPRHGMLCHHKRQMGYLILFTAHIDAVEPSRFEVSLLIDALVRAKKRLLDE
jgi:hypothetical protein